ncbi:type IV secretion system protein [Glycomyces sp. NPDC047010]|uniref:type IV secretion system protein n=1 Tax=Glycomyces sp. NPDC047010 TaxID=3155023 RepID=UPI003405A037
MPDWLVEALEGFLEFWQGIFGDIRSGLISFLLDMDWIHLSNLSWVTGQPLATEFLTLAYVGYGLVIVVGGLMVMSHESIQTRYTIREIAPRLVAGLLLAGLSATLVQQAMDVNNSIVDGFSTIEHDAGGSGVEELEDFPNKLDPDAWWNAEADYADCVEEEGEDSPSCEKPNVTVDILWILLTTICLLVLIFTAFIRNIVFFFLVVCAPVALACHGLPVTEWAATLWWRMLGACMASSIGQAALVWVWVKMTYGFYWGHLFHIQVVHLYLLVIVWMMWKVHQQAFRIARGRPLSIPGSRLVGALVMSKLMDGVGRGESRRKSDQRRPGQQPPNQPGDRFSDLPPEPPGFGEWAGFRNDVDSRPAQTAVTSPAPETGRQSPMQDAAPVGVDGSPVVGGSSAPYTPTADAPPRRQPSGGVVSSPLDDASPDPAAGTRPAPEPDPLAGVPDGTLIERREAPPVVQVRRDEVVPLAQRRQEAIEATQRRAEEEEAQGEQARARAEQQQADLRRKAQAAMARMAAAPGARSHTVPAAGEAHAAPPPSAGRAPGLGPALDQQRLEGGER